MSQMKLPYKIETQIFGYLDSDFKLISYIFNLSFN
jgi:hypothetical protein